MQPEDVQKAADAAIKWVNEQMSPADLVAVASIGSSLQILSDFSSDKEQVHSALQAFSAADGTAFAAVDASTDGNRRRRQPARPTIRRPSTSARRSSTRSTTTSGCAR